MRHYILTAEAVMALEAPSYVRLERQKQVDACVQDGIPLAVGPTIQDAENALLRVVPSSGLGIAYIWNWNGPWQESRYEAGYNEITHGIAPLWRIWISNRMTCEGESLDDPATWQKIVTDPVTMQKVRFSDLYAHCQHCGRIFLKAVPESQYCSLCEPKDRLCVVCGCVFSGFEGTYCCSDACASALAWGNESHNYGYKPKPQFYDGRDNCWVSEESPGTLYMGFELELDGEEAEFTEDKVAAVVSCHMRDVYCKHDGSLDNGIEIVSHPGTLKYHMQKKDDFNRLMAVLSHYGYEDEFHTCGLHVHVNRSFLRGKDHAIAKLVCLSDRFYDELMTFARRPRDSRGWCEANYEDEDCENAQDYEDTYEDDERCFERYRAINLRNADTIEFRIFHSTMEWHVFIAALQLVDTMVRYACSHSWREVETCSFAQMVASPHRELNTYLSTYMQRFMAA